MSIDTQLALTFVKMLLRFAGWTVALFVLWNGLAVDLFKLDAHLSLYAAAVTVSIFYLWDALR